MVYIRYLIFFLFCMWISSFPTSCVEETVLSALCFIGALLNNPLNVYMWISLCALCSILLAYISGFVADCIDSILLWEVCAFQQYCLPIHEHEMPFICLFFNFSLVIFSFQCASLSSSCLNFFLVFYFLMLPYMRLFSYFLLKQSIVCVQKFS